jgi:hypothetical protein
MRIIVHFEDVNILLTRINALSNLIFNVYEICVSGGRRSLIRCGQTWLQKRTVYFHSGLVYCSRCWTVRPQCPRPQPPLNRPFRHLRRIKRTLPAPIWPTSSRTKSQSVSAFICMHLHVPTCTRPIYIDSARIRVEAEGEIAAR